MRVFVAGATGAMGKQLVPRLIEAGHRVIGMTRTESKQSALWNLGAEPVVADALDPEQVADAVARTQPEVIVHQLTAIAALNPKHFDRDFALTNRLRIEGTDHLLSAGRAVGVRAVHRPELRRAGRMPARAARSRARTTRSTRRRAREMRESLAAIRHLEEAVMGADWTAGIVLRYGGFYGPGTSMSPGGEQFEIVRKRKFPVVGSGGGMWSFVHIADAAEATVAAVERGERGIYNVVDDEPAPVAEWLPALAQSSDAPQPMARAAGVGRLAAGEAGAVMMTEIRGASNAKAKRELGLGAPASKLAARVSPRERLEHDDLLAELRPTSFAIAYRMLGSVAEAEDVVQEALLRVHRALERGQPIESPRAFMATVTTRLAIDELRSARARRERYVGEWLPEPIVTDERGRSRPPGRDGRLAVAGHAACCSRASRRSSAPCCCCATCSTTATTRSRGSSARARRTSGSWPAGPGPTSRSGGLAFRPRASSARSSAQRFFAAVQDGDVAGLEALLAHDVVLTGDGGGKVPALARQLRGRSRVAHALLTWVRLGARIPGARCGRSRSTARRARSCSTARAAWSGCGRSRSRAGRSSP